VTTTLSAAVIESLLRRASEKLVDGDVLSARLFFERAAAAGSEAGTMGAAKTYDPDFLRSLDATGPRGDIARAIEWYRKAASLFGNRDAEKRLSSLAVAKAQPDYP
jgi:TPR repeat protein